MIREIASSDADLIHVHLPNPGAVLAVLASRYRGRLVATWHSDVVRQKQLLRILWPFLRTFLSLCDAIVVSSREYLDSSTQLQPWTERCHVIPYGIRVDHFDTVDEEVVGALRERHGARIVLAAGRLVYYKGFEYLVRAIRYVDATLMIVGDGPEHSHLQSIAREAGVQSRVVLVGHVEDIRPYYHAADVFVLPSVARSEAFGIVQLEAMACRKPIVNTNIPTAVPGVSLDGVSGFTVPPADPVALAKALNRLLNDNELRASFGNRARQRVERLFAVENMADSTAALYKKRGLGMF